MADLTITAASVQNGDAATIIEGDANASITAGQAVYKDANGKFGLADAGAASPIYKVVGIAIDSGGTDQPIKVCTQDAAFKPGATLVIGTTYVLSDTPGGICPDADGVNPMRKQVLGVATAVDTMLLKIVRSDAVIPEEEE